MKRALPWLAVVAALAVALAARYLLVEPEGYGFRCESAGPWWCPLRAAIVASFRGSAIGWGALVLGAAAFVARRSGIALLAAMLGAAGLVLYSYEPAAVGFALGTLVLARARAPASSGTA